MQLSFSIDVILGTQKKAEDQNREQNNEESLDTQEDYKKSPRYSCSTPIKEEICSPRSFTVEWKPPSSEKRPFQSNRSLQCAVKKEKRNLSDQFQGKIHRSPPNARVFAASNTIQPVTSCIQSSNYSLFNSGKGRLFDSNIHNQKMLNHRLFSSRFLPYPTETLQHSRIYHHPHDYPFHLPFLQAVENSSYGMPRNPGMFSPQYSSQHYNLSKNPAGTSTTSHIPRQVSPIGITSRENAVSPCVTTRIFPECDRLSSSESEPEQKNTSDTTERSSVNSERNVSPSISCKDDLRQVDKQQEEGISDDESHKESGLNEKTNKKSCAGKNTKRVGRRLFTGFQILELEKTFAVKPYLNRMERAYMSQKVNLTECQIKTWFQNRRTKEKRRGNGSEEDEVSKSMGCSIARYSCKPVRIPGYGIQIAPSYGLPDHHLQAAIVDYMRRRSSCEVISAK